MCEKITIILYNILELTMDMVYILNMFSKLKSVVVFLMPNFYSFSFLC